MHNRYKIYKLIDPRDNTVKYIGLTKRALIQRFNGHISNSKKFKKASINKSAYKINWINKLIELDLLPIIELIEDGLTSLNVNKREQYWINYYSNLGYKLTNSTSGGEGIMDYKHSKETKALLKLKLTGRTLSNEHRKNIGISSQRPCTESAKSKLRVKANKQWSNPELLNKMKERTGSNNPNYGGSKGPVCQLNTEGIILNEYSCLGSAATALQVNQKSLRGTINRGSQIGNHFYKFKKDI